VSPRRFASAARPPRHPCWQAGRRASPEDAACAGGRRRFRPIRRPAPARAV